MTQLLTLKRQKQKLHQVSCSVFQQTLNTAGGQRVKNKKHKTVVYDNNNRLLAILKNASIDAFGRSQPTQYFISSAA
ncbi:MAG: hypothetical protein HRU20_12775 [Pseudomonadales bacterium]|nr:hypothetical protein [Pseudomonadales bacterium]